MSKKIESNFGFIVLEYGNDDNIIFESSHIWTEEQANDLHAMFKTLNGDTYNSWVSQDKEVEVTTPDTIPHIEGLEEALQIAYEVLRLQTSPDKAMMALHKAATEYAKRMEKK